MYQLLTSSLVQVFYSRNFRNAVTQILVICSICSVVIWLTENALNSLNNSGYVAGFGFLSARAGISIPDSLIVYSPDATFGVALLAGFINTVVMSIFCIVAATIIGFFIGLGRLSTNWILKKICLCYVELFRNIPPLLVIFFVYFGALMMLPDARSSLSYHGVLFLNKRGLFMPSIEFSDVSQFAILLLIILIVTLLAIVIFKHIYHVRTMPSIVTKSLKLILSLVAIIIVYFLARSAVIRYPLFSGFNFSGGWRILPEGSALFVALSLYTGALIAETIRSGFQGVDRGYLEAANALGFKKWATNRLVLFPLALRIIVPPLAGQYMNLVKNTSLGVAIGYSELTRIGNSIIESKNQAIEVIFIWLIAYLGLSLIISVIMNLINNKVILVEG